MRELARQDGKGSVDVANCDCRSVGCSSDNMQLLASHRLLRHSAELQIYSLTPMNHKTLKLVHVRMKCGVKRDKVAATHNFFSVNFLLSTDCNV